MKQKIAGLAISIIAALVLAELLALAWYYLETGTLFYRNRPGNAAVEPAADVDALDPGRQQQLANRGHPFFGYVKFPNPANQVNTQGFVAAPQDYPLAKTDDNQYFIGIFGGSVSARFSAEASAHFVERLKEAPFFRDKEIKVLNFGSGGYKQPQQLLILNYYLATGQVLDMVINIDGFNEVALSRLNQERGIDLAMPSADHILPIANLLDTATLTPERVQALARIYRYRDQINRLEARVLRAPLAAVWFVQEQWRRILSAGLSQEMLAYQGLASGSSEQSLFYVYPATGRLDDAALYESIAGLWANASLMMSQALRSRDIPYYHFLQPNQYYSKKVFSVEEAAVALTENHPYRTGAEKGYPVLEAKAQLLEQGGVHFFSGVPIFDDVEQPIYKDDCCHFNQVGNDMLADFIADSILTTQDY